MKKFLLFFIIAVLVFSFYSCEEKIDTKDGGAVRVMVSADSGATVLSENPIEVKIGESASFEIKLDNECVFERSSYGNFDSESGILTVENVTERMNVIFETENIGYDTTKTINYIFKGESGDTTSVVPSPKVKLGTDITLKANNAKRIFVGWSIGKSVLQGGNIISTEREYTLRVTPSIVSSNSLYVYANYIDSNIYYYDVNGGKINSASVNMTQTKHYTAQKDGERVKITMLEKYFDYAEVASTFYDDGTFSREGYVLLEYNTKPDGTGESYSLGSKYYTATGDAYSTLYCIWAKDSDHSDFEYSNYVYERPDGVSSKNSPNWNTNGVIITAYNGSDERIVIPEYLGGKPVIAISAGAFSNIAASEIVISKNILKIEDGAFKNFTSLKTVYFSDCIYEMSDAAFDAKSYENIKNLYVNATIAPRVGYGMSVKLCRVLANPTDNRIIVIAGSSTYQGLGTEYLEALLENKYTVVNFGTTRTTHGLMFLEAMGTYAHSGDIIIFSPENSSYMLGERELYWKSIQNLEGMYNIFRCVDISNYTSYFSAFSSFNRDIRYKKAPQTYENMCESKSINKYGDNLAAKREQYNDPANFTDVYYITLNERIKSKYDGEWNDKTSQDANKDYTDPDNITWCSITEDELKFLVNHSISVAKSSGAAVYFGFAPVDADSMVEEAKNLSWLNAYDTLIKTNYIFDGIVGSSKNYIFAREYIYDCAYHVNDYGRTYRTYNLYLDLSEIIGIEKINGILDKGIDFEGCLFESGTDGTPKFKVDFLFGG